MASSRLAIVFGGGGARAAYQVGVLRWLARRWPDLRIPVLTGVSMGSINAVYMAHARGSFPQAVEGLTALWSRLSTDRVMRTDPGWFGGLVLRRLGLRRPGHGGLLDTSPLRRYLIETFGTDGEGIPGIAENLSSGRLSAVAVGTTDLGTGRTTAWIQVRDPVTWESRLHRGVTTTFGLEHLLASVAVPLFFPAVRLAGSWHVDGAIRQFAPLVPALRLGADRILCISSRHQTKTSETNSSDEEEYPGAGIVGGILVNVVFQSLLDEHVAALEQIRALAEKLPVDQRPVAAPGRALVLRPSLDPGRMGLAYRDRLPFLLRLVTGEKTVSDAKNLDLFGNVVFEPRFIAELLALGERDAEARAAEIEAFVAN